jgi:pantoate--beta-alanine ligase
MELQIYREPLELQRALRPRRNEAIAFVPTMGYLHEGHATLIRRARELAPIVVVSVFVNPLQFGPHEDYNEYPRDIEHDKKVIIESGGTTLFYPSADLLTPPDLTVTVNPGPLAEVLCGRSRPGHFRGVCTIVAKLFHIVQPDYAVFGWKDAQQLIIIKKMVQDLNFPVEIVGVETVREPDGLAMSSRNTYLSAEERKRAPILYEALRKAQETALANPSVDRESLIREIEHAIITKMGARIDYIEIVRQSDLSQLDKPEFGNTMIAAAVYLGKTRLIDNVRF